MFRNKKPCCTLCLAKAIAANDTDRFQILLDESSPLLTDQIRIPFSSLLATNKIKIDLETIRVTNIIGNCSNLKYQMHVFPLNIKPIHVKREVIVGSLVLLAVDADNPEFLRLLVDKGNINLNGTRRDPELILESRTNAEGQELKTDIISKCGSALGLAIDELNKKRITKLITIEPELLYTSLRGAVNLYYNCFQFPLIYLIRRGPPWINLYSHFIDLGIDVNRSPYKESRPLNAFTYLDKWNINEIEVGLKTFIQNGLMNFSMYPFSGTRCSLLLILLSQYEKSSNTSNNIDFKEVQSMLHILISLGFGRGPVEYESDRNLVREREYFGIQENKPNKNARSLKIVENLINCFDSELLSLKELCRNSLRLSIGGIRFKERVEQLPLPSTVKNFIIIQNADCLVLRPESGGAT